MNNAVQEMMQGQIQVSIKGCYASPSLKCIVN